MSTLKGYRRFKCSNSKTFCETCRKRIKIHEWVQAKHPERHKGWRMTRCHPPCEAALARAYVPPDPKSLAELLAPQTRNFTHRPSDNHSLSEEFWGFFKGGVMVGQMIDAEVAMGSSFNNLRHHTRVDNIRTTAVTSSNTRDPGGMCFRSSHTTSAQPPRNASSSNRGQDVSRTPKKQKRRLLLSPRVPAGANRQRQLDAPLHRRRRFVSSASSKAGAVAGPGSVARAHLGSPNGRPRSISASSAGGGKTTTAAAARADDDEESVECLGEVSIEEQIAGRQKKQGVIDLSTAFDAAD